uniref:Uncharacterized protein n=1 Tax=Arundo donax TaxID=35708 RepID=A0A0A9CQ08_ARUDO
MVKESLLIYFFGSILWKGIPPS